MVGFNRRFFTDGATAEKGFFSAVQEPLLMHYRVKRRFFWMADHWTQDPEEGGGPHPG